MTGSQRTLHRLISDDLYVVDPRAVADAILARAQVRSTVAGVAFRSELTAPVVRSFRRAPGARSFRLQRSVPLQRHGH